MKINIAHEAWWMKRLRLLVHLFCLFQDVVEGEGVESIPVPVVELAVELNPTTVNYARLFTHEHFFPQNRDLREFNLIKRFFCKKIHAGLPHYLQHQLDGIYIHDM